MPTEKDNAEIEEREKALQEIIAEVKRKYEKVTITPFQLR